MTLKRFALYGAATLTALTLASCSGGGKNGGESTTSASVIQSMGAGNATAELLNGNLNVGELSSFAAVPQVLDRAGIGYSGVEDTSDDPRRIDNGSGNLEIDGIGKVYFALVDNPGVTLEVTIGRAADGGSDVSHEIIGENWTAEVYAAGEDDQVVRVADALYGRAYAIHGGDSHE